MNGANLASYANKSGAFAPKGTPASAKPSKATEAAAAIERKPRAAACSYKPKAKPAKSCLSSKASSCVEANSSSSSEPTGSKGSKSSRRLSFDDTGAACHVAVFQPLLPPSRSVLWASRLQRPMNPLGVDAEGWNPNFHRSGPRTRANPSSEWIAELFAALKAGAKWEREAGKLLQAARLSSDFLPSIAASIT